MRKFIGISLAAMVMGSGAASAQSFPAGKGYVSLGHSSFEGSVRSPGSSETILASDARLDALDLKVGYLFEVGSVMVGPELAVRRGTTSIYARGRNSNGTSFLNVSTGDISMNGLGVKLAVKQNWGDPFISYTQMDGDISPTNSGFNAASGSFDFDGEDLRIGVEQNWDDQLFGSMSLSQATYSDPNSSTGLEFKGTSLNFSVGYRF